MSDFVERICKAQNFSKFNIEEELLEFVKKQIERRKDNWFILFETPHTIKDVPVTRRDKLVLIRKINDMFKDHSNLYVLRYRMNTTSGETYYVPEILKDDGDLLDNTSENLYGLYFHTSPYKFSTKISSYTVRELL